MKLICTLLVRDEIDIIKPWMDYHLKKFDEVIVTDNGSVDGTREALDKFPVTVIDEPGRDYQQSAWVGRMVDLAIEHGADWVINSDADEFWLGDYHGLIARFPECNSLIIQSKSYHATFDDPENEDPTRRLIYHSGINDEFKKTIFKADVFGEAYMGNHTFFLKDGIERVDKWIMPTDAVINHYHERSWSHFRRKYIQGGEAYQNNYMHKDPRYGNTLGYHWKEKYRIYCKRGGIEALRREWEKSIKDSRGLTREPLHG